MAKDGYRDDRKDCRSAKPLQILAVVEVVPHEILGQSRQSSTKLAALTVSRRNVPNVFAHAPQFTHFAQVTIKSTHTLYTLVTFSGRAKKGDKNLTVLGDS